MRKNAIFIGGCPRSGTTLITALLDHHSKLTIFPEEYLYLTPAGRLRPKAGLRMEVLFKEKVLRRLKGETSFLDQLHGKQRQYAQFDYPRFERRAQGAFERLKGTALVSPISARALALMALVAGFRPGIEGDAEMRWVVKHPHYEHYGEALFADFPDARMIWMVRDPREVILSRTIKREKKRYLKRGGKLSAWRLKKEGLRPALRYVVEWKRSLDEIGRLENAHPGRIVKIRYEDLVGRPAATMGKVADFLGIRWEDALLTPSFLGVPWQGDSMQGKKFDGIAATKGSPYRLAPRYLWQIEAWLGGAMSSPPGCYDPAGKRRAPGPGALLAPMRGEGPRDYLRNRRRLWAHGRNPSASSRRK